LDGPVPKLCPAVALSLQDGRHSAIALLLKAALIQVSDNRLLGASGLKSNYNKYIISYFIKFVIFFISIFLLKSIYFTSFSLDFN
jgi:hypothetical protein